MTVALTLLNVLLKLCRGIERTSWVEHHLAGNYAKSAFWDEWIHTDISGKRN